MAISVYQINKGINKSIEFKGLKAQYIWYLGGVVIGLMILFSVLYILGVNQLICLAVVGAGGFFGVSKIFSLSKKYGEHGLSKMLARRKLPKVVKAKERVLFFKKKGSNL